MARKPLDALGAKLTAKPASAQPALPGDPVVKRRAKAQPDGRKGVLIRLSPSAFRQLKILGIELNATTQELGEQAINALLTTHGRPPIA